MAHRIVLAQENDTPEAQNTAGCPEDFLDHAMPYSQPGLSTTGMPFTTNTADTSPIGFGILFG
jgi:hypothetical protein